jgi:serine/threonine-protein kinase
LVGLDGTARIIDFGVARAEGRLHTTQAGQVKGKIPYMSPEQLRGEEIDTSTDIYAAGVVLWEALTGRRLFRAEGDGGLVVQVLEANIVPPSQALASAGDAERAEAVGPLDAIVMCALAKDKAARWQNAREFSRALEAAVVPASPAQVGDWVESAAGQVLKDRAALIAEVESASAIDLTTGEFRSAMARMSQVDGRAGVSPTSVTTVTAPVQAPPAEASPPSAAVSAVPSADPATIELPRRPTVEPSLRAPIFIEAVQLDAPPAPPPAAPAPEASQASSSSSKEPATPPGPDLSRTLPSSALSAEIAEAQRAHVASRRAHPSGGAVPAVTEAVVDAGAVSRVELPLRRSPVVLIAAAVGVVGLIVLVLVFAGR